MGLKGQALDSLGRYDRAIDEYDKALAIDPNNYIALQGKKGDHISLRPPDLRNLTVTLRNSGSNR